MSTTRSVYSPAQKIIRYVYFTADHPFQKSMIFTRLFSFPYYIAVPLLTTLFPLSLSCYSHFHHPVSPSPEEREDEHFLGQYLDHSAPSITAPKELISVLSGLVHPPKRPCPNQTLARQVERSQGIYSTTTPRQETWTSPLEQLFEDYDFFTEERKDSRFHSRDPSEPLSPPLSSFFSPSLSL